ncbi:MAG: aldehyde dehydrogenase family protein [Synechococcaceae cyanobacterium]|nr:aldehyde dehydrogenase family protein [Synechococcaceae cyanobacterium]
MPAADSGLPCPAALREPVLRGETLPARWRFTQLARLEALLAEAEQSVPAALAADLGKPALEAAFELSIVRAELRHTRRHLRRWMRPQRRSLPLWTLPAAAWVEPTPLGCVLILSPWNYPFQLCLQPLVSALAAGNTAVIKPSERAPVSAALIARLVERHLPADCVQVALGDGQLAARLVESGFDHILFTGSGPVGRCVMETAARTLTPITLELGGRNPAIVLADADLAVTARRLAWGKSLNAGQSCVAPDHLLVVPAVREALIQAIAASWRHFHGEQPLASPDLARVIDERAFERLESLLQQARHEGRVLAGGGSDRQKQRIEPTLIAVHDPDADPLLQEELFGPLLPLLEVADLNSALDRLRRSSPPLTLSLFGGGPAERRRLLAGSRSGSVVFNDVILPAALAPLPFGGVGASGMGSSHGEAGFRAFSQQRSVLTRAFRFDLPLRYPPYAGKLGPMRWLLG